MVADVSYINGDHDDPKLKKSIAVCGSTSVEREVEDIMFNAPELFVK